MPSGEVIKEYSISSATGLKDPTKYCQIQCTSNKYHYFALKLNKTCQCIGQVPLGGKRHNLNNLTL
jgi:hypothetical protein